MADDEFGYSLYPNPSGGEFKLMLSPGKDLPKSIVVMDVKGNAVKSIVNPQLFTYDISIKEASNGLYLVKVIYAEKTVVKKLVKN